MEENLRESIVNLQIIQSEIDRMCKSLDFAYSRAKSEGIDYDDNWNSILGTLAASIILRTCALNEEIEYHFLKHLDNPCAQILDVISKLDIMLSKYDYKTLRDAVLAHSNRVKTKMGYQVITFSEIMTLVPSQSHTEYMKFGYATEAIINTIVNQLF